MAMVLQPERMEMEQQIKSSAESTSAESTSPIVVEGAAAPETAVSIKSFSAFYGDFQAICEVDLDIAAKTVTSLIGPSGCGKSTFLKWINRMNDMVAGAWATGSIQLNDLQVLDRQTDVVALRRRIGMVFQKPNPFPKSIFDNVAYGPRLHFRISKSELADLVQSSLQKAALWDEVKDRLNRSALGLSGGQQQRLCIARAIAIGPQILLMDEPCSALDPASTSRVEDLIYELREQYAIVIVTHNMHQAARCSDRTAFFFEGKIVEEGETDQVFTKPLKKQTEDYVTGKFG